MIRCTSRRRGSPPSSPDEAGWSSQVPDRGSCRPVWKGAGREASIGVSIRLPFETGANPVIAGDAKYVSMKYFFTRKLMLIKESVGFVCLPGGFGTLDETFELLTLTQTGKGVPVPIVLLDTPDDPYWEAVDAFIRDHLVARSMVDPDDVSLYRIRHDAEGVAAELESFYANFHSIRFVGDRLIIRLRDLPSPARLDDLRRSSPISRAVGSSRPSSQPQPESPTPTTSLSPDSSSTTTPVMPRASAY